jgi:hypothetical protein
MDEADSEIKGKAPGLLTCFHTNTREEVLRIVGRWKRGSRDIVGAVAAG